MGAARICSTCGEPAPAGQDHCPADGTPFFPPAVMARVGMVLHDHKIEAVIGEGGMGVVYRAQHVVIEKPVAIKVLHDHFARQKEMVEQFIIEAKAASRIRHPNIIDVTDFGTTGDGLVFLVMEYLEGESLEDRLLRVGRVPVFEAVNIIRQVARGLGAAHEQGIIHRDLKPANIYLCQREGRRRVVRRTGGASDPRFVVEPEDKFDFVKLLDFGVAKFMNLGPSAATRAGFLCGTPHYLSPEQAKEQPATERSDIYALGAVFYEMVTGGVPFDGSSMFEILRGHVAGELTPPSRQAPGVGIGPDLDALIGCCLAKEPDRRFASAEALCAALSECVCDRAFLRDAHRLPGIQHSGLDLSQATPAARGSEVPGDSGGVVSEASSVGQIEEGFSAVEGGGDWADLEERGGRARVHRETARIRLHDRRPAYVMVALLLGGVGWGLWSLRAKLGLPSARPGASSAAAAWVLPTSAITGGPALPPGPGSPPPPAASLPGAGGPALAPGATAQPPAASAPSPPAPARPDTFLAPAPPAARLSPSAASPVLQPAGRSASTPAAWSGKHEARPHLGAAGGAGLSAPIPVPPEAAMPPQPAPETVAAEPAPPPPGRAATPADVEGLLREAQLAWSRKYWAGALEKARAVLQLAPDRLDAYQIIAVCSCATGAAAEAKAAALHLDAHKQKLVRSICKSHGVSLEDNGEKAEAVETGG
ncbi:MAG: serine/threonine-protein kinase [Polyangia bacterium]|jgi:serine/threonine-protein kinase